MHKVRKTVYLPIYLFIYLSIYLSISIHYIYIYIYIYITWSCSQFKAIRSNRKMTGETENGHFTELPLKGHWELRKSEILKTWVGLQTHRHTDWLTHRQTHEHKKVKIYKKQLCLLSMLVPQIQSIYAIY